MRILFWSWLAGAMSTMAVIGIARDGISYSTWMHQLGLVLAAVLIWSANSELQGGGKS